MNVVSWRRTAIAFGCAVWMAGPALAQPAKLSGYNADIRESSVSGVSSGGFMAVQFGTAWSSVIRGVGVVAGGPYWCAKADGILHYLSALFRRDRARACPGRLPTSAAFLAKADRQIGLRRHRSRCSSCAGRKSTFFTAITMLWWRGRSPMRRQISIATISARPTAAISSTRPRSAQVIRWSSRRIRRGPISTSARSTPAVYRPVRLRSGRNHPAAHLRSVECSEAGSR